MEPVEPQQPEDLGPVTGIEVTERVEELLISWDEFAGADGYRIQWKPQGELEFDHEDTVTGGNTTSYTITGLDPVTEYTVRVIAILSDTESLPVEATGTPLGEETVQPIPDTGQQGSGACAIGSDVPGEVSQSALLNMLLVMSVLLFASGTRKTREGTSRASGIFPSRGYKCRS